MGFEADKTSVVVCLLRGSSSRSDMLGRMYSLSFCSVGGVGSERGGKCEAKLLLPESRARAFLRWFLQITGTRA